MFTFAAKRAVIPDMDAPPQIVSHIRPPVPPSRYFAFFAVAIGICAADLATKSWMFARLGMPSASQLWWLWRGVFGFQTGLNEGALFGIAQGFWPLFAALSICAVLGIFVWLFALRAAHEWLLTFALALVTAGIFGNLYDRLGLPGLTWDGAAGHQIGAPVHAVRDFILVMIGRWPWPAFNLADSSLVCGAMLLFGHALFAEGGRRKGEGGEEEAEEGEIAS
jgi:signal peptidase II